VGKLAESKDWSASVNKKCQVAKRTGKENKERLFAD